MTKILQSRPILEVFNRGVFWVQNKKTNTIHLTWSQFKRLYEDDKCNGDLLGYKVFANRIDRVLCGTVTMESCNLSEVEVVKNSYKCKSCSNIFHRIFSQMSEVNYYKKHQEEKIRAGLYQQADIEVYSPPIVETKISCKMCNSKMNRQDFSSGEVLLVCSNSPYCSHTISSSEFTDREQEQFMFEEQEQICVAHSIKYGTYLRKRIELD